MTYEIRLKFDSHLLILIKLLDLDVVSLGTFQAIGIAPLDSSTFSRRYFLILWDILVNSSLVYSSILPLSDNETILGSKGIAPNISISLSLYLLDNSA